MTRFATVVSLGALGVAIGFVVRPTEAKLALMRPLTLAAIFAAIFSFTAGIAFVLREVAASGSNIGMRNVYMGLSDTLVPLFVTNAFLAVA